MVLFNEKLLSATRRAVVQANKCEISRKFAQRKSALQSRLRELPKFWAIDKQSHKVNEKDGL